MSRGSPGILDPLGSPVSRAALLCGVATGLAFALTSMPGFLPLFGASVLVTVLAMREAMVTPGSLFICFFTLLMLVAPYLDLRLEVMTDRNPDLYAYWPEYPLLLGIVTLILVMLCVHLATIDRWKIRAVHLALRRIPATHLLLVTFLGIGCELALFSLGAGRHTAGFNSVPFVGVLSVVKTLPEMLIALAAFAVVRSPRKRVYVSVIVLILAENLVTSLLSGRKEDLMMSVLMALVGFWSSVRSPARFVIKTIVPILVVAFVFLPFMYRLRAHPAFNRMDHTSTPIEIIRDTMSGRYADLENHSNVLQRMDLLEPVARYVGKTTVPMYDAPDLWLLLTCSVIPRFLWPDKPAEQPSMGYQFSVHYGYASDYGITSIAFGYLVELHFLFGPAGILMLALLPWAFNSGAVIRMLHTGTVLPMVLVWVLYSLAVFVERTIVFGIIETAPYVILALMIEGALVVNRAIVLRRLFPRPLAPCAAERAMETPKI